MQVRLLSNEFGPNGWLSKPMAEFWKEFSRDFDRAPQRHVLPQADAVEDAEAFHFYFEMPGLKRDSIEVNVDDGRLVIEAERGRPEWAEGAKVHLAERFCGSLRRTLTMPEDANEEGIQAAYRDGVLEVTIPKKPETKPRKIKIRTDE